MSKLTQDYVLRPYQKKIVDELSSLPSFALYMGTGTGKTITSLHMAFRNGTENLLVICPKSVISQWKAVIRSVAPRLEIVEYKKSWSADKMDKHTLQQRHKKGIVIIINFEVSFRMPSLYKVVDKSYTIIVDEIHRIKNWGTARNPVRTTHAIVALGLLTDYKIGLTATPTQGLYGGFIDYYPQLRFLGYLDMSYKDFVNRYVIEQERHYSNTPYPIKEIVGYKNTYELENILKVMARRYTAKYEDFKPEYIPIRLERAPSYPKTVREKVYKGIMLSNNARTRIAKKTLTTGRIMGYDMESNYYEYEDNTIKIDWLRDFLTDTDEVVAIFYTYDVELRSLRTLLAELGKKFIEINGKTKDKYYELNNKEYDVVIGQFQAMSESLDGLHLKCHIEVFFSMPESSLLYTQALGRIDRDGQTKPPMYYFLIMEGTIDEVIHDLIERKVSFSEDLLEKLEI